MAIKFIALFAAPFILAGTAHAQAGSPDSVPGSTDASGSVMTDRSQQYAYDNIREEVDSEGRTSKRHNERAKGKKSKIVAATTADLTVGAMVHDSAGAMLGTIEAVKPEGVQLLSGGSRAMIPADVFGKKDDVLILNVTKAEYEKQTAAGQ